MGNNADGLLDDHSAHFTPALMEIGEQLECGHCRAAELPSAIIEPAVVQLDGRVAAKDQAALLENAVPEVVVIHQHRLGFERVTLDNHTREHGTENRPRMQEIGELGSVSAPRPWTRPDGAFPTDR